jgi:hypothetical protein
MKIDDLHPVNLGLVSTAPLEQCQVIALMVVRNVGISHSMGRVDEMKWCKTGGGFDCRVIIP